MSRFCTLEICRRCTVEVGVKQMTQAYVLTMKIGLDILKNSYCALVLENCSAGNGGIIVPE